MAETKPQVYKYCDLHMRPSIGPNRCNECFGAQPNPTNETISSVTKPPVSGGFVQPNTVDTPPPQPNRVDTVLTDPTAQKVVEAAKRYAEAIEAVKIISEQLKDAKELVAALEEKFKGNRDLANAAQDELRNATTVKR